MYGWRSRIGMLYPSAGISEAEFYRLAPDGVSIHTTRMSFKRSNLEEVRHLSRHIEEGARLLADAKVHLIAFNCTAGSLAEGKGHDRKIIQAIEKAVGIPATTTATAVLEALEKLGKRRIILITPYVEAVNETEIKFLRDHGHEVVASVGLGIDDPYQQAAVDPKYWYQLARERRDVGGDVYFISCAGIRVVEMIAAIEHDTGLPVVTSNQALMWHCLKLLELQPDSADYGELFRI